mmetsp:Transcript_38088/g.73028  ORF Transcript_38088/g.73028 Transcript_38088/m.73028 type:complete len:252 (-) Transcript_38088:377-1132(-)
MSSGKQQWMLEMMESGGRALLVDRHTSKVYKDPRNDDWPQLLGRIEPGTGEFTTYKPIKEVLFSMDAVLKGDQAQLKELFKRFDKDGLGALESRQIVDLVREMLELKAEESELSYLGALLDPSGEALMSYDDLVSTMRDCINLSVNIRSRCKAQLAEPLRPLASAVQTNQEVLKNLYRGFAAGDRGALGPQEVLQVLRSALPGGVSPLAARHLLLNLKCLDLAGEARISFKDLQQVLRLVQVSAQVVNALA